jgi:hypothetical protein
VVKVLSVIFLTIFSAHLSAQAVNNYISDIDKLYSVLKNTPSFKDQIKGKKLRDYLKLYESLKQDTAGIRTDYDVFYKLAQLFFPFRDNHLGFYQFPNSVLDKAAISDSMAVRNYRASKTFQDYPTSYINVDSLELALQGRPKDSIEGIYFYDSYLKVGLFRPGIEDQYLGVVLATTLPHWNKGQIAIRLYEYLPNYFRAVYGHPVFKGMTLTNNEKFRNHSLINSYFYSSVTEAVYKKDPDEPDFVNIGNHEPEFQFKNLNTVIQYIRLGNFSAKTSAMKVSQEFYDRIKDSLAAPNLIVDLRNNTGGAFKVSKKFLELIKSFSRKGKVFVVINNGTMSQGEMFTLQLQKLPNVITYGQTTRGTVAYGSNYGKTERLPSGRFQVYITDMKDKGNYLPYESYGVVPDIALGNDGDWINLITSEIENE